MDRGAQFPYEFRHRVYGDENMQHPDELSPTMEGRPIVEALLSGKVVGTLQMNNTYNPGEIEWVGVDEPHRGKGVANKMLQHAIANYKHIGVYPKHSSKASDEGKKFIERNPIPEQRD